MECNGPRIGSVRDVFSDDALAFIDELHRRFERGRADLLQAREAKRARLADGDRLEFPPETAHIRERDWTVAPPPSDLADRRVEITGPVDRKMMINALNSGAKAFMADFEDSCTPSWANVTAGQVNLFDAVRRTISLPGYELRPDPAVLLVRPRGLHLPERHLEFRGAPSVASLVDFGIYFFNNADELMRRGSGPYFYLPKLESRHEARWWNEVFTFSEQRLGLPVGTIRATVLIETIHAAMEMDEILWELRDHSAGLNAGRWDYIFSLIKTVPVDEPLPDRGQITMTTPFMRAYTDRLVQTCHRRGIHAMGGMAAFVPSRRDPSINERAFAAVRRDKEREASDGFDGTWIAHPDLVEVAQVAFDDVLDERPNQIDRRRADVDVAAEQLLDLTMPDGTITDAGLRVNVEVGLDYLASWLSGNGAVALNNLMEDAATAEISRSQIWQWVSTESQTVEGTPIDSASIHRLIDEVLTNRRQTLGEDTFTSARYKDAAELFIATSLSETLPEFLTLSAYELI